MTKKISLIIILIFCSVHTTVAEKIKKNKNLKLCVNGDIISAKVDCKKNEKTFNSTISTQEIIKTPIIQGPKGPAGFSGQKGDTGLSGPPGRSSFDPLKSGNGAFGIVGGDYGSPPGTGGGTYCANTVFYRNTLTSGDYPVIIVRSDIIYQYCAERADRFFSCCYKKSAEECFSETVLNDPRCTGSYENPTAIDGVLCIYPKSYFNAVAPYIASSDQFGFRLCWTVDATAGHSSIESSWALSGP